MQNAVPVPLFCVCIFYSSFNQSVPTYHDILNLQWGASFYSVLKASLWLWDEEQQSKHCSFAWNLLVHMRFFVSWIFTPYPPFFYSLSLIIPWKEFEFRWSDAEIWRPEILVRESRFFDCCCLKYSTRRHPFSILWPFFNSTAQSWIVFCNTNGESFESFVNGFELSKLARTKKFEKFPVKMFVFFNFGSSWALLLTLCCFWSCLGVVKFLNPWLVSEIHCIVSCPN